MNLEAYVFADFGKGHEQNLMDGTEAVFGYMGKKLNSESMFAIYRDNGLVMRYAYLLRVTRNSKFGIEKDGYFGIGIVINETGVSEISEVRKVFENVVRETVEKGEIICYGKYGKAVNAVADSLKSCMILAEDVVREVRDRLKDKNKWFGQKIREAANDLESESVLTERASDEEIKKEIEGNRYVFVRGALAANSLRRQLEELQDKNDSLCEEKKKLENELFVAKHKQRNTLWVSIFVVLSLVLGLAAVSMFSYKSWEISSYENENKDLKEKLSDMTVYDDLADAKQELEQKEKETQKKTQEIIAKNDTIDNQSTTINELLQDMNGLENKIDQQETSLRFNQHQIEILERQKRERDSTIAKQKLEKMKLIKRMCDTTIKHKQETEKIVKKMQDTVGALTKEMHDTVGVMQKTIAEQFNKITYQQNTINRQNEKINDLKSGNYSAFDNDDSCLLVKALKWIVWDAVKGIFVWIWHTICILWQFVCWCFSIVWAIVSFPFS